MSNLKKWAFSPVFFTIIVVVALGMYFTCAATNHWWPLDGSVSVSDAENDGVFGEDEDHFIELEDPVTNEVPPVEVPQVGPPWAQIEANPSTITKGMTVTITWNSENLKDVVVVGVKPNGDPTPVGANGSLKVTPQENTTYYLRATELRDGKPYENNVYVAVVPPLPDPIGDLHRAVEDKSAAGRGPLHQMNIFWDSYCNSPLWTDLSSSYQNGTSGQEYDGKSRYSKLREIQGNLVKDASELFKKLLSEARKRDDDYVMAKGSFYAEEEDRCGGKLSESYSGYGYYG